MKMNLDWQDYFAIADQDLPFDEKLAGYMKIARKRFDVEAFESFCARHLPHMDEVADEFFATGTARDAIHQKVTALFPAHEIETFTELFWNRVQEWRRVEGPGK
jgi:hypothetical protein